MKHFFSALLLVCAPVFAYAAGNVVINEIAWMGTQASASDEWIELYNNTQSAFDLTGWTVALYKPATTTPSKIMTLSGSIPAEGFYLIERTNDATVSDIPADLVSSFGIGLIDSGMIVELLRNGVVVDRTPDPCGTHWCAGSNAPKMTMERISPDGNGSESSNWATNNGIIINGHDAAGNAILGTPKARNSVFADSAWTAVTSDLGNSAGNVENSAGQSETTATVAQSTAPGSSLSGAPLPPQPTFSVNAGADRTVLAGAVVEFIARSSVKNDALASFRYTWNFGDGTTKEGRAVNHVYLFPGNYTVNVTMASDELAVSDVSRISVAPPLIIFSEIKPGERGFIELYNAGKTRIDAGGLILTDGAQTFTLPDYTYLDAGGVLVLANTTTNITGSGNNFSLNTANGVRVDGASISGVLGEKESFVRFGDAFFKTAEASPGIYIPFPVVPLNTPVVQKQKVQKISVPPSGRNDTGALAASTSEHTASRADAAVLVSDVFSKLNGGVALGVSILLGIAATIGFLLFRRFF